MIERRIQSVARMHDALQAEGGNDTVNLAVLLETMCRSLHAMGGHSLGVDVRVEVEAIHAPVAFAQPISLAVNELVVNALRHAFPDGRAGSILIRLECVDGQLHVLVADDGVGLPADHAEGRGYGMKLVRMMSDQINGAIHIDTSNGTRITILCPDPQLVAAAPTVAAQQATEQPGLAARSVKSRDRVGQLQRKPWKATGRG